MPSIPSAKDFEIICFPLNTRDMVQFRQKAFFFKKEFWQKFNLHLTATVLSLSSKLSGSENVLLASWVTSYGSTSTILSQSRSPAAGEELLAVVFQDVWVLRPELVSYNVAVVGLHLPPAGSHRHVLLLFTWGLHAFNDSFFSLQRIRNRISFLKKVIKRNRLTFKKICLFALESQCCCCVHETVIGFDAFVSSMRPNSAKTNKYRDVTKMSSSA